MWGNEGFDDINKSTADIQSPAVLKDKKRLRSQNIVAVTASQIIQHANKELGILAVGDSDVGIVVLLGLIKSVDEKNTCITYQLDDGTDVIDVKHFVDVGGDIIPEQRTRPLPENTYCRVFGHVRAFNERLSVVTLNIRAVTDPNDIAGHVLEAMRCSIFFAKHKQVSASQQPMDTGTVGGGGGMGDQSSMFAGANTMPGLSVAQRKVYDVIRVCPTDTGISVQDVMAKSHGLGEREIRAAIDFLSSEGHVYSTIDDDHYKSTDG